MSREQFFRRQFLQTSAKVVGIVMGGSSTLLFTPSLLESYSDSEQVAGVLAPLKIETPDVVKFQLREYLMKRVPKLPSPETPQEWTAEEKRLRKEVLNKVIFHGWPENWVNSPLTFEDVGSVPTSGKAYRIRKLRYEIVPGFMSTAIMYEPEKLSGNVPAILNLSGHSPQGKAAEYEQKRCINYALRGMFALHLEWLGMGELGQPENDHWFGAHLNLVGACATGLFYLAMRRGLDYLFNHPNIDPKRIGVTGLSGGAWQTIVLSALDERVFAALPVSGYFPFVSSVERGSDVGDIEYNPPNLRINFDYTTLTAMRAPRPTLLIYAAMDQYGMRAPLGKPYLFDDIKPFFRLYGKEDDLAWHENVDPGTHNYALHNREQSYAFFTQHLGLPPSYQEIPVDADIKSCEELAVGLPQENLTILGLARKFATSIERSPIRPDVTSRETWARSARTRLTSLVGYKPGAVKQAWAISSTRDKGLETLSYRLEFANELSCTAVWLKATTAPPNAPSVVILNDDGFQSVQSEVFSIPSQAPICSGCRANSIAWHLNRGEQVLALNLIFTGDASPDELGAPKTPFCPSALFAQLLASIGEPPIGIEASQLIAATSWLKAQRPGSHAVVLESTGIRSQVAALVAAALAPDLFSKILIRRGMPSLDYLLNKPVTYQEAPDLFCLGLYKEFDIDNLIMLAGQERVRQA